MLCTIFQQVVLNCTTGTYWDETDFSACGRGKSGKVAVGGAIGQLGVGILPPPSQWGHAVGEENLSRAAFTLAFDWLSGCHFAFFNTFVFLVY